MGDMPLVAPVAKANPNPNPNPNPNLPGATIVVKNYNIALVDAPPSIVPTGAVDLPKTRHLRTLCYVTLRHMY